MLRVPNLVIVAATMLVFAFGVLYPALNAERIEPILWLKDLYLLVLITVCVAVFGYLHNDLTDVRPDFLNKGKRAYQVAGKTLVCLLLTFFAVAPVPIAFSLALEINKPWYVMLYFVAVVVVFAYNVYFKKLPLIGNFIVAALCASVIGVILLGEYESLVLLRDTNHHRFLQVVFTGAFYMSFAFILTFLREVAKDAEDMEGDSAAGYKTFPISFGDVSTKRMLYVLTFVCLMVISTGLRFHNLLGGTILIYLVLIVLPTAPIPYFIHSTNDSRGYGKLSAYLKVYMLSGLLFLLYLKNIT